jgi:hypothetical protein
MLVCIWQIERPIAWYTINGYRELRSNFADERITWVISSTGYSEEDRNNFITVANDIGVNIRFIHTAADLIEYINYGGFENFDSFFNREDDKISKFVVFSHGLKGSIELGYNQPDANKLRLTMNDIDKIDSDSFSNPNSWFGSCNTGTNTDNGISFAQAWVNKVGGSAWATVGKTNYGNIANLETGGKINALNVKLKRLIRGFMSNGSFNYPVEGTNAYWKKFD